MRSIGLPRFRRHLKINLALQGGGAHGAFTWGVLDRLLEEDYLSFGWISATSAGAVNAAALVSGLVAGGRDGARAKLREVWEGVHKAGVPDLLRLPHVGVEDPVDLRGVGQHRGELEDVAVDLELDPRHVVQDVPEPGLELDRVAHAVVDGVQVDRRVLDRQPVDVLDEPPRGR